jgi:prepilin peptidase CpaA
MAEWQETVIQGGFVFLVLCAMLTDLSTLRVPNLIPLALCGLFLLSGATGGDWQEISLHMLVGIGALAGGFWLFSLGVLGGGDAKLAAAVALWMGPSHLGAFLLLTVLLGGLAALALIGLKKLIMFNPALESRAAIARPAAWARAGKLPYALPIGLSALILGPGLFS